MNQGGCSWHLYPSDDKMNGMSVRKPNYPNQQRRRTDAAAVNAHESGIAAHEKAEMPHLRERSGARTNADLLRANAGRNKMSQSANSASQKSMLRNSVSRNSVSQKSVSQKSRNVREKFGKDWDIVLSGSTTTRKIPVRILALLFTCAIAVIILAGPLQDFFAQQEEKRVLNAQLAESKAELESLQQQVDLWNDPSYVQAQARKRLGFVMPGQTLYYVSGNLASADDEQKQTEEARAIALRRKAMPFYVGLWKSIEIAGTAELGSDEILNPEDTPLVNEPKPEKQKNSDGAENNGSTNNESVDNDAGQQGSAEQGGAEQGGTN